MNFADSYLGGLRQLVGPRPLLAMGARALINDGEGRFLILRRSDSGDWGLPGGSMELGESLLDVVHREAFEETNLRLRDVQAFGLSSDPVIEQHTYPNGDKVQNISLLAHGFAQKGLPRSNDGEAFEFRFAKPKDIDPAHFVKTEYPTFAHWERFCETGLFQLV
ncbi:MAG: NUDIX domain-containing protein [Rhodobacteraceae bacterium]|nr:NUDIX domain-containing protein [Paracoccaceae bacterium]